MFRCWHHTLHENFAKSSIFRSYPHSKPRPNPNSTPNPNPDPYFKETINLTLTGSLSPFKTLTPNSFPNPGLHPSQTIIQSESAWSPAQDPAGAVGPANCGIPMSSHCPPLCVLWVPKERLGKTARWSVPRAFRRPRLAGPWSQARKPCPCTRLPGVLHAVVRVHMCAHLGSCPTSSGKRRARPPALAEFAHTWEGACSLPVTDEKLSRTWASSDHSPASSSLGFSVTFCKI